MEVDREARMIAFSAITAVSTRIRLGPPIDEDVKPTLVDYLLDLLDDENDMVRDAAIAGVIYAELVADPVVRARVERIPAEANSAQLARMVAEHLAHYDRIQKLRAEGKWHEMKRK